VKGRPDTGLIEMVRKAKKITLEYVGGESQAIEVVRIAVVDRIVPQVAVDRVEIVQKARGSRQSQAQDTGRDHPTGQRV
jgi:hypothetical protein